MAIWIVWIRKTINHGVLNVGHSIFKQLKHQLTQGWMIAVSDIISLVAAERKGTFHHPCLHPGTHVSMGRREVKVSAKQMSQIPVGITSQSFNPKPQGIVFCIFFKHHCREMFINPVGCLGVRVGEVWHGVTDFYHHKDIHWHPSCLRPACLQMSKNMFVGTNGILRISRDWTSPSLFGYLSEYLGTISNLFWKYNTHIYI